MTAAPPDLPTYNQPPGRSALQGVRIVDFTRVVAGPFSTQILADLGAEVIKVEHPVGGDDNRLVKMYGESGGESAFFLALNRSKQSVAVNLKSEKGIAVALDLIDKADVVIENFTAPVMRRFKLDYPSLRERFPKLIYCSISAYGRSGSNADYAGYDFPIAAEAGLLVLNAQAGSAPVQGLTPYTDLSTGLNATIGILAALHARGQTGLGQFVDTSMFATALANLNFNAFQYFMNGTDPKPTPAQTARPRGQFETIDGSIVILVTGGKMFRAFCYDVAERPDWFEDPRWANEQLRMTAAPELLAEMRALFASKSSAIWSDRCRNAGIPCGVVRTPSQAVMSPEAAEAGLVFGLPHPTAGLAPAIAHGFKLSETPFQYRAPPLLGEHTRDVLDGLLGYSAEHIQSLSEAGAIGLHPIPQPTML